MGALREYNKKKKKAETGTFAHGRLKNPASGRVFDKSQVDPIVRIEGDSDMSSMLSPEFKQLDMTTKQTGEARERIQSQTDALKVEAADSDSKINSLIDQINTMKLEAITSK
eukprot:UN27325